MKTKKYTLEEVKDALMCGCDILISGAEKIKETKALMGDHYGSDIMQSTIHGIGAVRDLIESTLIDDSFEEIAKDWREIRSNMRDAHKVDESNESKKKEARQRENYRTSRKGKSRKE